MSIGDQISDGWSGHERRSIPLHLIRHVSEVMDAFRQEETGRHERLEQMVRESNDRYLQLEKSVVRFADKADQIYEALGEAFPADKKGRPDFTGHARAHESWIDEARESRELRAYIKKIVAASAAVAILSWLAVVVWPAFLQGPK